MNEMVLQAARSDQDARGKIRTFTGLYVNPLAMRPEDIDIRDIAHHLSNECRYAGACPKFYSVAQHSVLVSRYSDNAGFALAGLLHDAAEAYLKDLPSPVKHDPRMAFYREVEHELTATIFERFELPPEWLQLTKPWDDDVFTREVRSWWGPMHVPVDVVPMPPKAAELEFLNCFASLYNRYLSENNL